jgi:hypothetical protein
MRQRARTDPCGGRSAMVVPTATLRFISRPVAGVRTQANYVLSTCGSAVGGEGTSVVDPSAFFTRPEQHNAPAE